MGATLHIGDALTVLKTLEPGSVDLVLSSPPYLALRSYLPADHPHKAAEMGSEANPAEFIDALLDVTEELGRVLAPHGSICIELGDTYAGGSNIGNDHGNEKWGNRGAFRAQVANVGPGWPLSKSLCMIPEAYRMALAYGVNPFNGRTCTRWRVRNVVRHFRPNPPVGALGDKWRPATSDWAIACLGGKRYFDLDAVRGSVSEWTQHYADTPMPLSTRGRKSIQQADKTRQSIAGETINAQGAPPLDWYTADDLQWAHAAGIVQPTHGYPDAHYATFSPALIAKFIECMTPPRVCTMCGKPSERITETQVCLDGMPTVSPVRFGGSSGGVAGSSAVGIDHNRYTVERDTVGWSDCGHNQWRSAVILDPFAGSGTTLEVATGHGHDAIGIELNPDNLPLISNRVGMFLEVAEPVDNSGAA